MIIYKATNIINNKVYIGQTIRSLNERKMQHENSYKYDSSKNLPIAKAIYKYGKENFKWEIIDYATSVEELNEKEEYWISFYDSIISNGKGYNVKYGGNNCKHIEETKIKIGQAQIGEKNHAYGKKGELSKSSKKVIDVYSGEVYVSATDCSLKTGLSISKICCVCRGDRGSTGGRVFRYLDDNGEILNPDNIKPIKRRYILNVYTQEIFKTCTLASKSKGVKSGSCLYKLLRNNNGICYIYDTIWCYLGTEQSIIDSFVIEEPKKLDNPLAKKVINLTTGVVYDSITEAAKSVKGHRSGLSKKLTMNNGECTYKNNKWKILSDMPILCQA